MDIRIASTEEEKRLIYQLRHKVYVEELGWGYDLPESQEEIQDAEDATAYHYFAQDSQGQVVAAYRLHFGDSFTIPDSWRACYALDSFSEFPDHVFSFSGRLVCLPEHRGSSIVPRILMKAYDDGWKHGVRFSFCFCRPRLVELYERLGFIRYKDNIVDEVSGIGAPMVMLNEDLEHLQRLKSPFQKICRAHLPSSETALWFETRFPCVRAQAGIKSTSPDEFWQEWSAALDSRTVAVLEGMTEEQVRTLLQAGTVLECKAGDILLREGEAGHEMFLILEGMARFTRRKENGSEWQAGLAGKGDAFGEVALVSRSKRTMSVEAVTHLKVLVISKEFLQRAMKAMPEIAMRLLYNLSGVLSQKLSDTTQRLQQTLSENEKLAVLMSKQQSGGKVQAEDTLGGQDRTLKVMKRDASLAPQNSFPQMKKKS